MISTCRNHPQYKAKQAPEVPCAECTAMWEAPSLEAFAAQQAQTGDDSRLRRLEDDLRLARGAAASANKRAASAERIRETVFGLMNDAPLEVPEWILQRSAASDSPHIPVLMASDFQLGEVIVRENMDGINEFNMEIAQDRYRRLVEKTIDISFEHLPKNRYEGLVYARLGDMISGDIHQELRETNEQAAVSQVKTLVAMETWGVRQLATAFGRVHVVTVPGNHGRTSLKPPTKQIAATNYDTLSAWWLEAALGGDARVSWRTPNSTDAVLNLQGRQYLLTHGDNMGSRGGQGFIGPAATILRGFKKTMDEYARRGTVLRGVMCGHYHTAVDVGLGWCNGSLPGYSEYARANRMTPEPPCQWLLFFHEKYGPTSQWKILLAPEAGPVEKVAPW